MSSHDFMCMICTSDFKDLYFEMSNYKQILCDCGNRKETRNITKKINVRLDEETITRIGR